jgi:FAS-associated factor 1
MSTESILEYLGNNYVLWAWDLTLDDNRKRCKTPLHCFSFHFRMFSFRLSETLRRCVGNQCAERISRTNIEVFPLLMILTRTRGSLDLLEVIEGKSTPSEVLLNLIQCHESFNQQRQRDAEEELHREQREELKRQQEDEYHRSIEIDKEKQRQREEDEQRVRDEQNASKRLQQQRLVNERVRAIVSHRSFSNCKKNAVHVFRKNRMKLKRTSPESKFVFQTTKAR